QAIWPNHQKKKPERLNWSRQPASRRPRVLQRVDEQVYTPSRQVGANARIHSWTKSCIERNHIPTIASRRPQVRSQECRRRRRKQWLAHSHIDTHNSTAALI
ncbi:uncharacterized protein MYCGRDRAFT_102519, partial [Zymoseptoria tritici IPO323]